MIGAFVAGEGAPEVGASAIVATVTEEVAPFRTASETLVFSSLADDPLMVSSLQSARDVADTPGVILPNPVHESSVSDTEEEPQASDPLCGLLHWCKKPPSSVVAQHVPVEYAFRPRDRFTFSKKSATKDGAAGAVEGFPLAHSNDPRTITPGLQQTGGVRLSSSRTVSGAGGPGARVTGALAVPLATAAAAGKTGSFRSSWSSSAASRSTGGGKKTSSGGGSSVSGSKLPAADGAAERSPPAVKLPAAAKPPIFGSLKSKLKNVSNLILGGGRVSNADGTAGVADQGSDTQVQHDIASGAPLKTILLDVTYFEEKHLAKFMALHAKELAKAKKLYLAKARTAAAVVEVAAVAEVAVAAAAESAVDDEADIEYLRPERSRTYSAGGSLAATPKPLPARPPSTTTAAVLVSNRVNLESSINPALDSPIPAGSISTVQVRVRFPYPDRQ